MLEPPLVDRINGPHYVLGEMVLRIEQHAQTKELQVTGYLPLTNEGLALKVRQSDTESLEKAVYTISSALLDLIRTG